MALIECEECSHKISDKAQTCPNCGTPLNSKKDLITMKVNKEKTSIITYLIYIIVFLSILFLVSSNFIFLKTIRSEYTLQQIQFSTSYEGIISLYPSIIVNLTFIASLLAILSRKTFKLSKIPYFLNIIISIIIYIYLYTNNLRVGNCFYIIVLLNTLFIFLPGFYKLKETEIEIEEKNRIKEDIISTKLQTLHKEKLITKLNIILLVVFLMFEIASLAVIVSLNSKDIYKETIIQANSDFQIEIINDYINIRKSANTEAEILGEVNKGDIYNVLDVIGGTNYIWYKIDYKGEIGYIASSRETPYIKELYSDTLVVNIFCTEKEDNCAYLLEFITRYHKNNKNLFLINYLDIEDTHNKEIYDKVLTYFNDEPTIPYLIIGNNKVVGYQKEENELIVEVISEQQESSINIVDTIKKDNPLPELSLEQKDTEKED